jgi:hypothetical protein
MLKWHLNVVKLQKLSFGSSDTLFLKTVRVALRRQQNTSILEVLSLNHSSKEWGCRSLIVSRHSAHYQGHYQRRAQAEDCIQKILPP